MFTIKFIRENGTSVHQCEHYSTSHAGGTNIPDSIELHAYYRDADKLPDIFSIFPEGQPPNIPSVAIGAYVMNEHGRTVDRIGSPDGLMPKVG